MEEINLILGDSSDIYEFSSKQVDLLDATWEGSWVVSETLGSIPILEGDIVKNQDIFNVDSLVNEDFRKSYKIFETTEQEIVEFNADVIVGETCTVSGRIFTNGVDGNDDPIEIPETDRYITVTLKGTFVSYTREARLKTDANGEFTYDFNIGATVKTTANSFFVFQLTPLDSESLVVGTYYLTVEVRQRDVAVTGNVIFRREVLQAKLKMTKQGVV